MTINALVEMRYARQWYTGVKSNARNLLAKANGVTLARRCRSLNTISTPHGSFSGLRRAR